jgi:hypothetical protein
MKLTRDEIRVVAALLLALILGTGVKAYRDGGRAIAPQPKLENQEKEAKTSTNQDR